MDKSLIANAFGTLGAVCWSIQLAPQIILNYRRHSASGLSPGFMLFWAWAGIPLGVYNVVSGFNYALWVQPQILTYLSLVTWGQCYYYERGWSVRKVLFLAPSLGSLMGGLEAGLIFALRVGLARGIKWPLTLMAVLAALLLALGVIEQYIAIYKNGSVHGISFLFCGIDALGDVTSIISVIFESKLNILGLVIYGVEFVLWCGVFACGFYFKWIPGISRIQSKSRERHAVADSTAQTLASGAISLQALPSSTSVFRTATAEDRLRSRHAQG
ncbi:hypothetical protein LTR37_006395 [Vermiconidia calcicola]|uniref:Uncharacterized protein n=1 Tax=Vermiconidia calcicola TaxID=1690605 RepID=A0ACC3NGG4_9PEZI|nr:hypothetical protein LTR37_006395 [Vermiconidia calcicola]